MYLKHNEEKSVVAERFSRTLITKIYKPMTVVSKNVYINKLDEVVDKYNITYYRTTKIKLAGVKLDTYIFFDIEKNDKDPKFKVGDHVRILKRRKCFCKRILHQIGLKKCTVHLSH